MTNLGIGISPLNVSNAPTPANFCQQGSDWSAGSEELQPEFVEPLLAGGFVVDVVDDVVLGTGHADEVRER
jgi:hypothetical protein